MEAAMAGEHWAYIAFATVVGVAAVVRGFL